MCITLLTCAGAVSSLVDAAEDIRSCCVAAHAVVEEHILTVHEVDECIGHPFAGAGVHEAVSHACTSECAIRLAVETMVILLVEDEDDTLITQIGHLFGCDSIV